LTSFAPRINLVANALSQSSDHVLISSRSYGRACFYVGCLNLHASSSDAYRPRFRPPSSDGSSPFGLYDVSWR